MTKTSTGKPVVALDPVAPIAGSKAAVHTVAARSIGSGNGVPGDTAGRSLRRLAQMNNAVAITRPRSRVTRSEASPSGVMTRTTSPVGESDKATEGIALYDGLRRGTNDTLNGHIIANQIERS